MPPACTGWAASPADILVAVAGSFKHDGDIDVLLARIGAISAKSNVRYWSTTEKRWQPLVTEAFALSGPDAAQRREDFTPAQFAKGQTLHYAQSDNRSSGKTVYRERVLCVDRDRLAAVSENLTPVKMTLITLFDTGDMQTAYFVERRSPGVWNFYSLTRTRMASSLMPIGSDASYINRAVAFYRLVAAIPTDQEPPAALIVTLGVAPVAVEAGRHAVRQVRQRQRAVRQVLRVEHRQVAALRLAAEDHAQHEAVAFGRIGAARHEHRLAAVVAGRRASRG